VGGTLIGLDEQLLRATPRVELLVNRGKTVRGLSAQGGSLLVHLPGDPIVLGGGPSGQPADPPRSQDLGPAGSSTDRVGN
jgi:hypothetical protein